MPLVVTEWKVNRLEPVREDVYLLLEMHARGIPSFYRCEFHIEILKACAGTAFLGTSGSAGEDSGAQLPLGGTLKLSNILLSALSKASEHAAYHFENHRSGEMINSLGSRCGVDSEYPFIISFGIEDFSSGMRPIFAMKMWPVKLN